VALNTSLLTTLVIVYCCRFHQIGCCLDRLRCCGISEDVPGGRGHQQFAVTPAWPDIVIRGQDSDLSYAIRKMEVRYLP
jgi:hypothetical protein